MCDPTLLARWNKVVIFPRYFIIIVSGFFSFLDMWSHFAVAAILLVVLGSACALCLVMKFLLLAPLI